jgi:hypothetical protein
MNEATSFVIGFAFGIATVGIATVLAVLVMQTSAWRSRRREDVLRRAMVTHSVLEGVEP